jgi:menaquinone-specific isochorismate synthase
MTTIEERTAFHLAEDAPFMRQRLVSVSLPCPGVDAMQALGQALGQERFYWQDPRRQITYVGFGIAADLRAWGDRRFHAIAQQVVELYAAAQLPDDAPPFAEPQLFGGFAFSDDFTPDNTWSIYHPAQFILPHYQLAVAHAGMATPLTWLTINALIDPHEDGAIAATDVATWLQKALQSRIDQLQHAPATQPSAPLQLQARKEPMSFVAWEQMLNQALAQCKAGRLHKVVLSRVSELRFRNHVNVDQALTYLNTQYRDCYRFLFEPLAHHAFFGASPELLVDLEGRQLTTMGLAGSERRGASQDEDARLGQALLMSAKDQHEHRLVVDALRARLAPMCTLLSIPEQPTLLKLSNIQHLYTPIHGQLQKPQNIFALLEQLHPTPALGGSPRADALCFISAHELAPRGWYAAPIGIVNRRLEGTFSVAIRSAVTEYERVWLHAGAGIVAASDPQKEWDETALKFRPILNALGVPSEAPRLAPDNSQGKSANRYFSEPP